MAEADWNVRPLFVTVPPFAGPADPRIEIGNNIPTDLIARYAAIPTPETIIGGVFFYRGTNSSYAYMILTVAGSFVRLCVGGRDTAGVISEFWAFEVALGAGAAVGRLSTTLAAVFSVTFQATNIVMQDFSGTSPRIIMEDNTSITMQDTADINFINDGGAKFLRLGGGTDVELQSGADFFAQAGSRVIFQDMEFRGEAGATFEYPTMRHLEDKQLTASTTSSTTYANLTNICGVSFTAPPSGIVTLHYSTRLMNSSAAGGAIMAPWVGTGSTVGSGTQVFAAADANAILMFQHSTASEDIRVGSACIVSGLTAGTVYNVSMRGRATSGGGTATFDDTTVIVVPSP